MLADNSDAELQSLLARLARPSALAVPLVVIESETGGASSSLLKARLVPALNGDESFPAVYVRLYNRPVRYLREALRGVAANTTPLPGSVSNPAAAAARGIDAAEQPLLSELRAARTRAGMPLLLLIDRLEELFLQPPPTAEREAVEAFLQGIASGAATGDGTRLVIAIRSDLRDRIAFLEGSRDVADTDPFVPEGLAETLEPHPGELEEKTLPRARNANSKRRRIGGAAGAILAVCALIAFCQLAVARWEPGEGERVKVARGLGRMQPLLGTKKVIADSGFFASDLSAPGQAAVRSKKAFLRFGKSGARGDGRLEAWLAEGAEIEVSTSADPRRIDAAVERIRALGRGGDSVIEALRRRLLSAVTQARQCSRGEADACRARSPARDTALVRNLQALSPGDAATTFAMKEVLQAGHPEAPDFVLALGVLDGLGTVDDDVIRRLSLFLAGSDLGARAAAMDQLATLPIRSPSLRVELRERTVTWVTHGRPAQAFVTSGAIELSALGLAMALGDEPVPGILDEALRAPAHDLGGSDGFFYDAQTQGALAILDHIPLDDEKVHAGIRVLTNDAIRNSKWMLAENAPRFAAFWRRLVRVAIAEGVDAGKLVFAIFEAEGDFSGAREDDPVLIALEALAPANPLGDGARDLIHARMKPAPEPGCYVEAVALALGLSDPKLDARARLCAARGEPSALPRYALREVPKDVPFDRALDGLWQRLVRTERDAGERRIVEQAIALLSLSHRAPGEAERVKSRIAEWRKDGVLWHRVSANRITLAMERGLK